MMNKKGFTLIELLIVIAVIGILAAIAAGEYQEYCNQSKPAIEQTDNIGWQE